MELKLLGMRLMIHLRGERRKSDLKKLVTEFRKAYHEVRAIAGEHITAEDFGKAVQQERNERIENLPTRRF